MRKLIAAVLTVIMVVSCAMFVFGESTMNTTEQVDVSRTCSLTVNFRNGEKKFAGETVNLYKVADISADKQYTVRGAFASYPISIVGLLTADDYRIIKQTVCSYILADGIAPDSTAVTDAEGTVSFAGLSCGLYLVDNVRILKDGVFTTFEAFAVAVPGFPGETISYDVTANPKVTEGRPTDGIANYKTVVIWDDAGDTSKRPNQVKVEIFKDGESYQTVTLSEENDWSFGWEAVDDGSEWSVIERILGSDYTVSYDRNGDIFEIINSHEPVPQTGDRGFSVYLVVMILAGAGLIVLGLTSKKKNSNNA